jgi:lipopolysaccharide transport system ATP-binding protein
MSDTVIRVENLSKKYILGQQKEGGSSYKSLRESMSNGAKSLGKKVLKPGSKEDLNASTQEFWALKDVSFEIKQGDRVGFIGRNGAGKSTLLKVLSRITEPTSGSIRIKGRVASLLEVGTGFHPELTGRENIFLNGAILGMSKVDIKRKFDEIVAFAEVEKFLDTPVKRYSSGMYVRLAFAVAAHLEPEILIVDEVLAVGDAQFQKKCLGKMEDVGKEGRTVLFVSHQMSAILSLCDRAILLNRGNCIGDGEPTKMISKYLAVGNSSNGEIVDNSQVSPSKKLKLRKLRIVNDFGKLSTEFELKENVFLEIHYEVIQPGRGYNVSFEINNLQHGCIFCSALMDIEPMDTLRKHVETDYYIARIKLPTEIMRNGEYSIKASSTIPSVEVLDIMKEELYFNLLDATSPVAKSGEGRNGCILPVLTWDIVGVSSSQSNLK